ncbi:TBC1 domain family member 13 [Cucumispora dikerogammari]|nr:TBC1 domain family member 13 [Cucumispora dikerogammari]
MKANKKNTFTTKLIEKYFDKKQKYHISSQLDLDSSEPINLPTIKNYINNGFREDIYRPTIWKLLLNYIPTNKFKIEYFINQRRELYKKFLTSNFAIKQEKSIIDDLNRTFIFPIINNNCKSTQACNFLDRQVGDRRYKKFTNEYFLEKPCLSTGFQEKKVLLKVQTLMDFTVPQLFKKLTFTDTYIPLRNLKKLKLNKQIFLMEVTYNETHREVINRLLQIHNQLNPAVGYIQGLHLLIIPIYYVLCSSENIFDYLHSETETFFLFINLIAEISECLVKNNPTGLIDKCSFVPEFIKIIDFDYFIYLKFHKVFDTRIYLKWIICLFGTEYRIPELIILWDCFLSDSNRYELVYFATVSILLFFKDELECLNTEDILIFLQSETCRLPVEQLIELSKKNRKKYYSKKSK